MTEVKSDDVKGGGGDAAASRQEGRGKPKKGTVKMAELSLTKTKECI